MDTLQLAEKKERIDIAIALIVVLLAGVMLWTYGLGHLAVTNSSTEDMPLLTSNKMGVERLTIEDRSYVPIATLPTAKPIIEKPVAIADRRVTRLHGATPTTSSAVVVSTIDSDSTQEPAVSQPVATDTVSTATTHNANTAELTTDSIEAAVPADTVTSDTLPEETTPAAVDKSCVIVVGAYGSSKNANKMKRRLADAGYTVFETPYSTLTRVGIYAPCHIDELSNTLREIRKGFASDATVLETEQ